MTLLKPYDWAMDGKSLVYESSRQKYLCPQGHECYESSKELTKDFIFCSECEQENPYLTMNGKMSKGLYVPIMMCKKIEGRNG